MDDLISRKAAVDTILGQTVFATKRELVERCDANISDENGWLGGICVALDAIEDLPSAQPDLLDAKEKDNRKKTEGYICGDTGEACTDCVEKCIYKHSLAEECEAVPEGWKKMMDLIERQMAIDALGERPMVWTDDDEYALGERNQYDIDRLAIETVPSAQSEQRSFSCGQENDLIDRQVAIDAFLTLGFVWDDSLSDVEKEELDYAIHGIIMAYKERIEQLPSAQPEQRSFSCGQENDLIDRQVAIDALWKALYEYEDKTEKQFQESNELDVADWIGHRIFVQNMSDIDRQTILNLPSAQPVARDINVLSNDLISRKATIAALEKEGLITAMVIVDRLPPVQPEPYQEEGDD